MHYNGLYMHRLRYENGVYTLLCNRSGFETNNFLRMGYRKHDKIKAFQPKTKYLTHDKDYWVEWISAGGYIAVKNDDGKIKPYAASNFYKGDL